MLRARYEHHHSKYAAGQQASRPHVPSSRTAGITFCGPGYPTERGAFGFRDPILSLQAETCLVVSVRACERIASDRAIVRYVGKGRGDLGGERTWMGARVGCVGWLGLGEWGWDGLVISFVVSLGAGTDFNVMPDRTQLRIMKWVN